MKKQIILSLLLFSTSGIVTCSENFGTPLSKKRKTELDKSPENWCISPLTPEQEKFKGYRTIGYFKKIDRRSLESGAMCIKFLPTNIESNIQEKNLDNENKEQNLVEKQRSASLEESMNLLKMAMDRSVQLKSKKQNNDARSLLADFQNLAAQRSRPSTPIQLHEDDEDKENRRF